MDYQLRKWYALAKLRREMSTTLCSCCYPSVVSYVWLLKRTISMRWFFWAPTTYALLMGWSRGGTVGPDHLPTPGKSEVAIGFLRNSGMDPLWEANCPSRVVQRALYEIPCWLKNKRGTPPTPTPTEFLNLCMITYSVMKVATTPISRNQTRLDFLLNYLPFK